MKRVALVTARQALKLDEDLPPLLKALDAIGVAAEPVVWDDPAVNWRAYELAVVRSTWDYVPRRDEFVRWAETVGTRLYNPAAILKWNTDKHYLRELAIGGASVVPTHWIEPRDSIDIPYAGDVVVKPAISAGSQDTNRYPGAAKARAHIERLQSAGRTVMVQPYLHGLDQKGETALVFIEGRFSHAIYKGAILRPDVKFVDGLYAQEDIRRREATPEELRTADKVLSLIPGDVLYARVDLAPGPDGRPMLLELELAEPSLFFNYAEGAADRLARAIQRLL